MSKCKESPTPQNSFFNGCVKRKYKKIAIGRLEVTFKQFQTLILRNFDKFWGGAVHPLIYCKWTFQPRALVNKTPPNPFCAITDWGRANVKLNIILKSLDMPLLLTYVILRLCFQHVAMATKASYCRNEPDLRVVRLERVL